jgi:rhodanese-related sulfurtransferase
MQIKQLYVVILINKKGAKMKKFDDLMKVSSEITSISADEAKEKLKDPNVQFIDVRDKNSFETETIGNAINLERGLLEFYLADGSPLENDIFKKNPEKEYVVFCGLGGQSTLASKTMQDMGLKNVKNLTGGMTAWKEKK